MEVLLVEDDDDRIAAAFEETIKKWCMDNLRKLDKEVDLPARLRADEYSEKLIKVALLAPRREDLPGE